MRQRSAWSIPKTLQTLSKIDSGGANPDAITFDAKQNEVWVFNHTGMSATEIDAATGKVLATIPLSGTAETGQSDGPGKVFVNIEDKDQIDVIDVAAKKVSGELDRRAGRGPDRHGPRRRHPSAVRRRRQGRWS